MSSESRYKHIGIVACSSEGAALCYRTICAVGSQRLGAHIHPEISMHTPPLSDYVNYLDDNNWEGVGELMLDSAKKLASIGADFLICPDNTIHQALPQISSKSPLPWLHIADIVAKKTQQMGFKRLGLTGTQWLVESNIYPEKLIQHGLEYLRPNDEEKQEINRIIMDGLVCGIFNSEATIYFQNVIKRMKSKGCDAVILGCTEIPLIINNDNSVLPVLDSTRLLAEAALEYATS